MVGWVVVRRVVCQVIQQVFRRQENSKKAKRGRGPRRPQPVAPEAYQVILKLGIIGQFREKRWQIIRHTFFQAPQPIKQK